MPLPFEVKRKQAAVIVKDRKDGGFMERNEEAASHNDTEDHDEGLLAAASDLLKAIEAKDHKAMAHAMRAAFDILESEPHEEGPHESDSEEASEE